MFALKLEVFNKHLNQHQALVAFKLFIYGISITFLYEMQTSSEGDKY